MCAKEPLFGAICVKRVACWTSLTFFCANYTRQYVIIIWRSTRQRSWFGAFFLLIGVILICSEVEYTRITVLVLVLLLVLVVRRSSLQHEVELVPS